jgi:Cu/Ag efflux protein CusF
MIRVTFLLAFLLALPLAGCGGGEDESPGDPASRAVVVAVDAAKGEITLDHEDIPGLMGAMKMTFHIDPALLTGIEPGQQVEFRAREEGGRYEVTAISPSP